MKSRNTAKIAPALFRDLLTSICGLFGRWRAIPLSLRTFRHPFLVH